MNISMAFPNTFSGGILCTFHRPRVPIYCAPMTSISCGTKHSAFTVHATQDDYAVTGSRKNIKSHSSPNATTNNAAKTSTSAEHKNSWYIAGLRLPEFLLPSSSGESRQDFIHKAESSIERTIFNFRFFALLAISGSLAGSLLCFLNGCVYIFESFKVYWTNCVKGVHNGQMVLRLVEAVDVYLAGTVMLIFGMGLYGLFISDLPANMTADKDRALANSSLFGMFVLKERPRWMRISSLDELKTKLGHVIVMILLVKMFERSKTVMITSGMDLLSYAMCIFLSSASLFVLHNLHK